MTFTTRPDADYAKKILAFCKTHQISPPIYHYSRTEGIRREVEIDDSFVTALIKSQPGVCIQFEHLLSSFS